MSSYDKVVKLACKPKAAPPKAKYLDQIIAATWAEDGAVHDVCKALSPRFREPNVIVVFKALIVLHTMIRNGATDNVLSYLSTSDVLRLQHVSSGNWEGYNAPQNLQNYAIYLEARVRAYRDLKHDAIRVQSESNRDLRNSNSIEDDSQRGRDKSRERVDKSGPTRSKTIMGRKLRVMAVEKGLLRETKIVQRMIDALVDCRFYLGDLEDELTTTALRMLVMDLLILFQAGNEGVINVLEHYFEMSHIDAKDALQIYRRFCKQTESVVEYLGVAKKLQNLLNVSIPNLKHAPVSLAGALQEYLDDPNFEQNRIEYKLNKEATEGGTKARPKASSSSSTQGKNESPTLPVPAMPAASSSKPSDKSTSNRAMVDFLTAIEEEQPTLFNQQTNGSPTATFQQSASPNPFVQLGMTTGQPFASPPFISQSSPIQLQPTGFLLPQQTAFQPQFQPSHFGLQVQQSNQTFPPPLLNQTTGFLQPRALNSGTPQLQPQPTGANPFRQSMMFPQTTGMVTLSNTSQFQQHQGQPPSAGPASASSSASFFTSSAASSTFSNPPSVISPFSQSPSSATFDLPPRPASTPLTSFVSSLQQQQSPMSPPVAQPVKTHQTGSRNPFGSTVVEIPPMPKQPTLMELAMGAGVATSGNSNSNSNVNGAQQLSGRFGGMNGFNPSSDPGGSDMSNVASAFSFSNKNKEHTGIIGYPITGVLDTQNTSTTVTGSTFSDSFASSAQSSQPTGATTMSTTSTPSFSSSPTLKPQTTGFSGLKPFKPTSSFGAALLESLPPIPGSSPTTSDAKPSPSGVVSFSSGGLGTQQTNFGALNVQPVGLGGSSLGSSSLGVGLRPQTTGSGAANPFRVSMMTSPTSGAQLTSSPTSTPFGGGSTSNPTNGPNPSFGTNLFGRSGVAFGSGLNPGMTRDVSNRQQSGSSLI